jgi:predicted GNAT family N-acyltransferase
VDGVTIKLVETGDEMAAAIAVRFRVFVDEQSVPPEEELDREDATATHAIALYQGQVIGTGRLICRDTNTAQIGRMAVDLPWRRLGIGSQILEFLEEVASSQGMRRCILHAQEYVKDFYARHGYSEWGDVFLEVNIPHIEMRKGL